MKAKAVALKPPAISRTIPRSHVVNETARAPLSSEQARREGYPLPIVVKTTKLVTITCRRCENGFSLKKNSSTTSRQT